MTLAEVILKLSGALSAIGNVDVESIAVTPESEVVIRHYGMNDDLTPLPE